MIERSLIIFRSASSRSAKQILLYINIEAPKLIEYNCETFDIYNLDYAGGSAGSNLKDNDIALVAIDNWVQ